MKGSVLPRWFGAGLLWLLTLAFAQPALAEFYVSTVFESQYEGAPALTLRFTEALDPQTDLDAFVTIQPAPADGSYWISNDGGVSWTLPFVEPSTTYQIRISGKPRSVDNQRLTTESVVADNAMNGQSDQWQITTRPMVASASFASQGELLVGDIQNGLPVTVVNQSEVELDVFRVRDDRLEAFLAYTFYSGRTYYSTLNELDDYADLAHSARYQVDPRSNTRTSVNLNLDPVLDEHDSGFFVAVLRQPGDYDYQFDTRFFTLSDLGLHARVYGREIQVQLNAISSGEPLEGVELTYYWHEQNRSGYTRVARTDEQGQHRLETNDQPRLIVARQGNQTSYVRLDRAALDLSAYSNVTERHRDQQSFLYGPRDLYRPGEQVQINMLRRDYDGQPIANPTLEAHLYDPRGRKIEDIAWRAGPSGLYQHSLTLPDDAATGTWQWIVEPDRAVQRETYNFQVETFLPERMTLSFFPGGTDRMPRLSTLPADIPVQGDYLYGAPAAGNEVDALATVRPITRVFEQWPNLTVGDARQPLDTDTLSLTAITLDGTGAGQLTLPDAWSNTDVPLAFNVAGSLYESGGRPVTRNQQLILMPPVETLVGIEPLFQDRPAANADVGFKVFALSKDGAAIDGEVSVQLFRDHREYYWWFDEDNGWSWRYDANRYVTESRTLTTTEDGVEVQLPVQWGDYELRVTHEGGARSVYYFRTQYSGYSDADSSVVRPDQIPLTLDQDAYEPGETATLRVIAPAAGRALINVESQAGVLYSTHQDLEAGESEITLPTDTHWNRHDLYVSLMLLTPANQVTEVAPKRTLGLIHLPMQRPDREFEVTVSAPDRMEPNQPIKAEITVENADDFAGQRLYATVALVDMGVLNITRYQRPQPEQFFFSPRRFEAQYQDVYHRIINNLGLDMVRQRFGGGFAESDDALSRGGEEPKSDVRILSYLSEPVEFIDGQAEVSFDLPDFNGRLKWMVVAWGERSFGSTEAETQVADRLVVEAALPRFMGFGDQSTLALDVHNLSGADQDLSVDIAIGGAISASEPADRLTLKDGEKTTLRIALNAGHETGTGDIAVRLSNGDDLDINRTWSLGVRSAHPWQTRYERTRIDAQTLWQPEPRTDDLIADTVQAQLTLSNRPAIDFAEHLRALLHYPYGCLEQTISSTYPWLLINPQLARDLGLVQALESRFEEPYTEAFRRTQIETGLARTLAKQKDSGLFGYWDSGSVDAHWGTVYAADLLVDARRLGMPVDADRLDRTLTTLQGLLRGSLGVTGWSDDAAYQQFAVRAYAASVLAKAGQGSLSDVRRLYDQALERDYDQSGLGWMQLAVALETEGDTQRAAVAADKGMTVQRERHRYYSDYGSPLRDAALTLALALEHGFEAGPLWQRVPDLMREKQWFSTQERVALAKLALQFSARAEPWQATLKLDSLDQRLDRKGAFNTLIDGDQLASLRGIEAGDQPIYASLVYSGAPLEAPEPYAQTLRVERDTYDIQGEPLDITEPLTTGDLVIVRLSVTSEARVPEALLVDLLPAGLEIENQNLANASVNLDDVRIDGDSVGDYFRNRVAYEEVRDDRYVAALDVSEWQGQVLYYLARAVTPGEYAIPGAYVEDMYRPDIQSLGRSPGRLVVLPR
ncbi:alpha-2-macroglobulin family protein [Saccharospirillum impatiens]|uniref:alpha-2-macroglobulin family protein n=1 Tax=Saccharospirillum impatiens TaxID=169438 RepID=UPI000420FCC4|nr:alpha-2-macroglobulin [Saccharospirillum impatiens]